MAIAATGDAIFWMTQTGDLSSAPNSGAPVSAIHITDVMNTGQIAVDENAIYVATSLDGLYRVDRLTSEVTQIDTGSIASVASNFGGDVYWSNNGLNDDGTPGVKRRLRGSSSTESLSLEGSMAIALDSSGVYWLDGYWLDWCVFCDPCKDSQVPLRQRANDGTLTTLANMTPTYGVLAADGEALYASDTCAGTITRFDHVSGAQSVLASGLGTVGAIAIDDRAVYAAIAGKRDWFGDVLTTPAIVRVPKNGGERASLPIGDREPLAVAVDDTTVFFIGYDKLTKRYAIFSVAKPLP